ncbi:MAG: hypothetical protein U0263_34455 [Polyangiaceae bacterium]
MAKRAPSASTTPCPAPGCGLERLDDLRRVGPSDLRVARRYLRRTKRSVILRELRLAKSRRPRRDFVLSISDTPLLVESSRELPLVHVSVALAMGAIEDPAGKDGLTRLHGSTDAAHGGGMTQQELDTRIDSLGGSLMQTSPTARFPSTAPSSAETWNGLGCSPTSWCGRASPRPSSACSFAKPRPSS